MFTVILAHIICQLFFHSFISTACTIIIIVIIAIITLHQPRSQGLSSLRGGEMKDPGNEVDFTLVYFDFLPLNVFQCDWCPCLC